MRSVMKWIQAVCAWVMSLLKLTQRDRVNLTEDGRAALLKLSRGDMRRALNVLQVSQVPPGGANALNSGCRATRMG